MRQNPDRIPKIESIEEPLAKIPLEEEKYKGAAESTDYLTRKRDEEIESLKATRGQKKEYGRKIFWLVALWFAGVYLLILLSAWENMPFNVPYGVLLAALTSTAANMAGLLFVIVKHLFPDK